MAVIVLCGRYSFCDPSDIQERFNLDNENPAIIPRYNIAPTQEVPVIIRDGGKRLELFKWGLIPYWAKDSSIGNRMINARAETVDEKPSFRYCLQRQRCLVPADGFFEWRKEGKNKYPFWIALKDGGVFSFAGLWDSWTSPAGETIKSFSIITSEANELVGAIHNRMPVILPREAEKAWLDPDIRDISLIKDMLHPYPAGMMSVFRVSPVVNSPKNDCPECIRPAR